MKKVTAEFYICKHFNCTREELKFHLVKDPLKITQIMERYAQMKVNEVVSEVFETPKD
jgi:hypothetical protein